MTATGPTVLEMISLCIIETVNPVVVCFRGGEAAQIAGLLYKGCKFTF
jgi:hypothetical protein